MSYENVIILADEINVKLHEVDVDDGSGTIKTTTTTSTKTITKTTDIFQKVWDIILFLFSLRF